MSTSFEILKKYWGHEKFRSNQEEIITELLQQKDAVALLPTGGGKSICYQLPALQMPGICLVISPLIALMQDQVQALNKKGIKASYISSVQSASEIDAILDNACYDDKLKFLYLSPERIQTKIFKDRIEKMPVNLIAVDEAHCISQWGHDFRPAYSSIKSLREWKAEVPIVAVTATATSEVVADIQQKLELRSATVFTSSFLRENIQIDIEKTSNKLNRIVELLHDKEESGILYCGTRKNVKSVYNYLAAKNYSVEFYHGGLESSERDLRQKRWLNSERKIIVCTNAFGMGIDKADVRFVIHLDIPDNPESFYQEIGRAGRDGQAARSVALYEDKDLKEFEIRHDLKFPEQAEIRMIYKALGNYFQLAIGSGEGEQFPLNIAEFCERYELGILKAFNVFKLLELGQFVRFEEGAFSKSRLKVLVDAKRLYSFQLKDKKLNAFIQYILRTHIGVFDDYIFFNEYKVGKSLQIEKQEIQKMLAFLQSNELIDYQGFTSDPRITYLGPRLDEKNVTIPNEILLNRKKSARTKLDAMIGIIRSTECISTQLLSYFGEDSAEACGKCSNCLSATGDQSRELKNIEARISSLLGENKSLSTTALIGELNEFSKDQITSTIRWMQDHKLLEVDQRGQTVSLKKT